MGRGGCGVLVVGMIGGEILVGAKEKEGRKIDAGWKSLPDSWYR